MRHLLIAIAIGLGLGAIAVTGLVLLLPIMR